MCHSECQKTGRGQLWFKKAYTTRDGPTSLGSLCLAVQILQKLWLPFAGESARSVRAHCWKKWPGLVCHKLRSVAAVHWLWLHFSIVRTGKGQQHHSKTSTAS